MAEIFKDRELDLAMEDLARSISMARIGNIDRDPATYIKLVERMGNLSTLLVKKLSTRPKVDKECVSRQNDTHEDLQQVQEKKSTI
jgi:hypothetical protein